jgi:uncharacterized protein with HEPN domain
VVTEADERRLEHILDQITRIERYTSGGRSEFDANEMIQDAVLRCLSVIGEAAAALTEPTAESLSMLPPHLPRGMRNRLVHEYWRVDRDIVWATVTTDLPALRDDIEGVLA